MYCADLSTYKQTIAKRGYSEKKQILCMTPLKKGYAAFRSGTFLAKPPAFHAKYHGKGLFLIAKWDANAENFSKKTFLQ